MKDTISEIIETCEKIIKLFEIKGDYPENVIKKLNEEYKLKLKEIVSKIEIDFSFLSEELEKIEREIEIVKKDVQELENSLKGLEIRYLIGELKESERDKKSKAIQKKISALKEKEESLARGKERIERIIKGGHEVAKEESKVFKVTFEEIQFSEEVEKKIEGEEIIELEETPPHEEKTEFESSEKSEIEEAQEIKLEPVFEVPSFTFGEEKKEEIKPQELIEKKPSEEKFEFPAMETLGITPEKATSEEANASEGKTAYFEVPYLIIKTSSGERKFLLSEGKNYVGRSTDCNIILNEKGISREHFVIYVSQNEFRIEDLNSKNGTFVNGKKIKSAQLKNGDEIIAGECSMIFEFG
ncbi:MAG: FHA domain-containing protein [Candidatus Aminicenantia bacterium]